MPLSESVMRQMWRLAVNLDISGEGPRPWWRRMKGSDLLRLMTTTGCWLRAERVSPPIQARRKVWASDRSVEARDDLAPGTVNSILKQAGLR